jgi:hypothetical protein
MAQMIHGHDLLLNEVVELAAVLLSESIEAGAADYLLLEAFV